MQRNAPERDKTHSPTRCDELTSLTAPRTLGTDADGAVHHYSPYDDRVVVVAADGTVEQSIDTADRRLAAYVAFVDEQRGWADLQYAESFGDILREALAQ